MIDNLVKRAFIIGNPRSGTTLTRLMLNSHPLITAPPECGFLQWLSVKYEKQSEIVISEFIHDVMNCKKFETWNLTESDLTESLQDCNPKNYLEISTAVYKAWGQKHGKSNVQWVIDKNNYYLKYLPEITRSWPDSKIIFVVRDGRDVACSYRSVNKIASKSPYAPNLSNDIETIAREWLENNQVILNYLNNCRSTSDYMILKYEDLITTPSIILQQICLFLGLNFDKKMVDFNQIESQNPTEPNSTIDWKIKTLEPVDSSNKFKYKSELLPNDIEIFQNQAISLLTYFGYPIFASNKGDQ